MKRRLFCRKLSFLHPECPSAVLPCHEQDELCRGVFFGEDEFEDFRVQALGQGCQKVGRAVCPGNNGEQAVIFQQGIGGAEKVPEGFLRAEERAAAQV